MKRSAIPALVVAALALGACHKTGGPELPDILNDPVVQCSAGYVAYKEYVESRRGGQDEWSFFANAYSRLQARCASHGIVLPNVPRT